FRVRTMSFTLWAEPAPAPETTASSPTTPAVQNSLTLVERWDIFRPSHSTLFVTAPLVSEQPIGAPVPFARERFVRCLAIVTVGDFVIAFPSSIASKETEGL